jgi:hypothetical protein
MTESSEADLLKGIPSRRRMIVAVAAALAGLAVGSDANGQASSYFSQIAPNASADSVHTALPLHIAARTAPARLHGTLPRSAD